MGILRGAVSAGPAGASLQGGGSQAAGGGGGAFCAEHAVGSGAVESAASDSGDRAFVAPGGVVLLCGGILQQFFADGQYRRRCDPGVRCAAGDEGWEPGLCGDVSGSVYRVVHVDMVLVGGGSVGTGVPRRTVRVGTDPMYGGCAFDHHRLGVQPSAEWAGRAHRAEGGSGPHRGTDLEDPSGHVAMPGAPESIGCDRVGICRGTAYAGGGTLRRGTFVGT